MIKSELLSIKIFLVKVTMKIGQEKYLLSILFWKLILGLINVNIETEKKWKEVFMKNNCSGVNYKWVFIQNQIVILEIKIK